MAVIVFEVAYDGAGFNGFARQKDESLRTVQGELEGALQTVLGLQAAPQTVCAGRTDAGVHALGQVVSWAAEDVDLPADGAGFGRLRASLGALTGDDVAVRRVGMADDGFSARFDAVRREYRYRIFSGGTPPLFLRDFAWWHRGELDVDAMRRGAELLVGEHDFASFCKTESAVGRNTVRTIEEIAIEEAVELGEGHLVVRVVGNAFLHSMVRAIVGTLVEVGTGRRGAERVAGVLDERRRGAAGPTAPAKGLTFWRVEYPRGAVRWG